MSHAVFFLPSVILVFFFSFFFWREATTFQMDSPSINSESAQYVIALHWIHRNFPRIKSHLYNSLRCNINTNVPLPRPLLLSIPFFIAITGSTCFQKKRGKTSSLLIHVTCMRWLSYSVAGKSPRARESRFKNPGIFLLVELVGS